MKLYTLNKSELPDDVCQTGKIYKGKEYDIAVFESACSKGRYAFLMENGVKVTRGKRIASGDVVLALEGKQALKIGNLIFEKDTGE